MHHLVRATVAMLLLGSASARAESDELGGISYGVAGAEVATAGTIALHVFTAASPGKGIGLALNFLPIIVGVGTGILGETQALDPRPALALHGAVVGGLSLLAIGASIDGRHAHSGAKLGPVSLAIGAIGAAGTAYLGATRVETAGEAAFVGVAPFVGAFAGGLAFAVVHFFDDTGPRGTGRLLRYSGAGMLLGTIASFAYAFEDRGAPGTTARRGGTRLLSLGGAF